MRKLVLGLTIFATLSGTTCNALETGNAYINSRSIMGVPTEWVVGFIVTAGFLAIVLSSKNTSLHAH